MGTLVYSTTGQEFAFDDYVLQHLQILFAGKLRRGENFFLSWRDPQSVGDGRSAVWIDPSIPLYFRYDGPAHKQLDRAWLEEMAVASLSPSGLDLSDDPHMSHQVGSKGNSVKRKDQPLD